MALVYRAHDLMLDREVAIKVLPPGMAFGSGMVERFTREAKTSAKLNHPNIIPIYRIGELKGTVYFVMKYVSGKGLDELLSEKGRLDIDIVSLVLKQIGDALSYAHRANVIHRDIKPSNIMIDGEGWALVMDFGIAKAGGSSTLTATGAAIGTPHYMSPEQCTGKDVTALSDQYSLAIMTYQMVSGVLPFDGDSLPEILSQHFFEKPEPLENLVPDCPAGVIAAINKGLSKKPEDRFDNLDDFISSVRKGSHADPDTVRRRLAEIVRQSGIPPAEDPPQSPVPLGKAGPGEPTTPMPVGDKTRPSAPTTPMPAQQGPEPPVAASQAPTTPMPAQKATVPLTDDPGVLTTPMPQSPTLEDHEAAAAPTIAVPGHPAAQSTPAPKPVAARKSKTGLLVGIAGMGALAIATWFWMNRGGEEATAPQPVETVASAPVEPADQGPTDPVVPAESAVAELTPVPAEQPPAEEAPPPAAPPANGSLRVTGVPSGARVRANGRVLLSQGYTALPPTTYTIVITADGYETHRMRGVQIRSGERRDIDVGADMRLTLGPVAAAPPPLTVDPNAHPSCNREPRIPAGSLEATVALRVLNCVPGLAIRIDARPNNDGLFQLKSGGRVRLILTARGYVTGRIDTIISAGTILVVSGALDLR